MKPGSNPMKTDMAAPRRFSTQEVSSRRIPVKAVLYHLLHLWSFSFTGATSSTVDTSTTTPNPQPTSGPCDAATAAKCGSFDIYHSCNYVDPSVYGQNNNHPGYQCNCKHPAWTFDTYGTGGCKQNFQNIPHRRLPQAYLPRPSQTYTMDENGKILLQSQQVSSTAELMPTDPEPWIIQNDISTVPDAYAEVSLLRKAVLEFAITSDDMKFNCAALELGDYGKIMLMIKRIKSQSSNNQSRLRSLFTNENQPETLEEEEERRMLKQEKAALKRIQSGTSPETYDEDVALVERARNRQLSLAQGAGAGGDTTTGTNQPGAGPHRSYPGTEQNQIQLDCAQLSGVWDSYGDVTYLSLQLSQFFLPQLRIAV
ncbi:unnamed protein product [Amoebophrya sp. A120]|nr:unnamed protein product [Amoebophrya sp. A120]|eukprot:GSA120T00015767001.1